MQDIHTIIEGLNKGDKRSLARAITIVENDLQGTSELLKNLNFKNTPVIGITGPPGAGKSSLINVLLKTLSAGGKKIGVIAIDPTSPFNYGSLLGDRLRMEEHFNDENIFIRSLATRGALGGLSAKTIEISDLFRAFDFDYIFVETVGVGQSEVEIVGLADTTVLVLVPESGDDIQAIKSGIMEIADIFVVNKSDRQGADTFMKNIHQLLHDKILNDWTPPVIKTIATSGEGVSELIEKIKAHEKIQSLDKKTHLFAEKAFHLIQEKRMQGFDKKAMQEELKKAISNKNFNLYSFIEKWI